MKTKAQKPIRGIGSKGAFYLSTILVCAFLFILLPTSTYAHRSGCHRWHSCPSDSGSYTCGDAGYPCQYPTYPASGDVIYPPDGYYKDCYDCPLKKVPSNAAGYSLTHKAPSKTDYHIFQVPGDINVYELSWWTGFGTRKLFLSSSAFEKRYGKQGWKFIKPIQTDDLNKYLLVGNY